MEPRDLSRAERHRYARHVILPEVGLEGQRRLAGARVLLVGAGGLGSPAALYLAAAGVGTLGLVDHDVVDATNLQRQILYGDRDVGRPKLDAAAERVERLNRHVKVVLHDARLTSSNALDVITGYDLVLDGTDNFPTRYLVNDACVLSGVPNVFGAVLRWEGQASVFAAPGGPCYRCLFPVPPPPGLVPNCAEAGVMGVLPGIVGSMQALEAVKWITESGESLVGRLLIFDALRTEWREVSVARDPACSVCGDQPTQTELIDYDLFCGLPAPVDTVSAEALQRELSSGQPPTLIDVREVHEWEAGNLSEYGALSIPLGALAERVSELPDGVPLVAYCQSGVRSEEAVRVLRQTGIHGARSLAGGFAAWLGHARAVGVTDDLPDGD